MPTKVEKVRPQATNVALLIEKAVFKATFYQFLHKFDGSLQHTQKLCNRLAYSVMKLLENILSFAMKSYVYERKAFHEVKIPKRQ